MIIMYRTVHTILLVQNVPRGTLAQAGLEALRNSNCAPDEELQDSDRRAST